MPLHKPVFSRHTAQRAPIFTMHHAITTWGTSLMSSLAKATRTFRSAAFARLGGHVLHSHRLLILLVTLALLHGALYATLIPPWQAPDETGHFEYAWLLAHLRRVPSREDISTGFEAQLIDSLYRYRFGDYTGRTLPAERPERLDGFPRSILARRARTVRAERFSLGYAVQALATLPLEPKSMEAQLYAARLSSVLLNALIVALAYLVFRQLFPGRELPAFLAAGIVLLVPQHTFINATAGDGTLAEAGAVMAIYGWVSAYRRRFGPLEILAIVAGTLIGNLSKNTVLFLIPVDLLFAAWWVVRRFWHGWHWWQAAALLLTLLLLCSGLWLWRDSALGQRAIGWLQQVVLSPDDWAWADGNGTSFGQALLITHDTFWADFGWLTVPLTARWYSAIAGLSLLALLGWTLAPADVPVRAGLKPAATRPDPSVRADLRLPPTLSNVSVRAVSEPAPTSTNIPVRASLKPAPTPADTPVRAGFSKESPWDKPAPTSPSRWAVPMSLLLIGAAFTAYAWGYLLSRPGRPYGLQGRYLFPVLIPFAYLLAGGWDRLTAGRRAPAHLLLAALALLDAWALALYVLPYYYG
jgi:hypothetical protein